MACEMAHEMAFREMMACQSAFAGGKHQLSFLSPLVLLRNLLSSGRESTPPQSARHASDALRDSLDALERQAKRETSGAFQMAAAAGVEENAAPVAASEDVRACLHIMLGQLEVPWEDGAGAEVARLLADSVLARLAACLGLLDFEARKEAMRVFGAVLKVGTQAKAGEQVSDYVLRNPGLLDALLDGSSKPGVFSHCAEMLRSCLRCPRLVTALLERGAAATLMRVARHPNFDIAAEAFGSLRELLLAHPGVAAAYVKVHFQEFFAEYHTLVLSEDYVTQRQAIRLLGEILSHAAFLEQACRYSSSAEYLQIHMNLLRHSSAAIQLEAYHVFRLFAHGVQKPRRVQQILERNQERLVKLIQCLQALRPDDGALNEDFQATIDQLHAA